MIFCTAADVKEALEKKEEKSFFLDVRRAEEYARGHVAGFVNVPVGSDDEAFIPYLDGTVYVMCALHGRSRQIAAALETRGARNVRVLHGGFIAWRVAGYPAEH